MIGVSRTIYVNVDSPKLGFPYFNSNGQGGPFLGCQKQYLGAYYRILFKLIMVREATKKETWFFGNFSQMSDPPSPLLETPVFQKKGFILHLMSSGAFLEFTKMFTFWSLFWHLLLGIGDPPSLKEKNSQNFLFSQIFFSQNFPDFKSR